MGASSMSTGKLLSVVLLLDCAFSVAWGMRLEEDMESQEMFHGNQGSNGSLTTAMEAGTLFAERYRLVSKMRSQDWPSSFSGYEPDKMLGRGSFGETWLAKDTTNEQNVAVKFFYRDTIGGTVLLNMANADEDEQFLLRMMKHECDLPGKIRKQLSGEYAERFAQCFVNNVDTTSGPSYMVLEVAGTMNLEEYMEGSSISVADVKRIAVMLFEGLVQMEHSYVHRDIKPANLMVTVNGQGQVADLKYIDFGFTVPEAQTTTPAGTPFYMPPELYPRSTATAGTASYTHDVYSVGETLYELLCKVTFHDKIFNEFYENTDEEKKYALMTEDPQAKCTDARDAAYQSDQSIYKLFRLIIEHMLAGDPSKRFTGSQLLDATPQATPVAMPQTLKPVAPQEESFLTKCHQNKGFWFNNLVKCCGQEKADTLRDAVCRRPCGDKVAFIRGTNCQDRNSGMECGYKKNGLMWSAELYCCVSQQWPKMGCQYGGIKKLPPKTESNGWLWMSPKL